MILNSTQTSWANVDINLKRQTQYRKQKNCGGKRVVGQGFEIPLI